MILEEHGIRFVEERYGSIGPLGRLARSRCYPKAEQPLPDGPRYDDTGRPAEEAFNLQDPVQNRRPGGVKLNMPSPPAIPERIPVPSPGN